MSNVFPMGDDGEADEWHDRQDAIGQEIREREGGWALTPPGQIIVTSSVHAGHPWAFSYRPPLVTDDPIELLRRHVMDFGSCDARETCDCSDGQAWRWLREHGIIDV